VYTLHLITTADVAAFLAQRDDIRAGMAERQKRQVMVDLAVYLAGWNPTWYFDEISLSGMEASIERGIGMMLRPLSRILIDAGLDRAIAQQFPIRLDANTGPAGGAYIPATLVAQVRELLESRLERQIGRMRDAEMDAVANIGTMLLALSAAEQAGSGVYEAAGIPATALQTGQTVVYAGRKSLPPELRTRLENAAKPQRKPGLIARMFGANKSKKDELPDSSSFWDGPAE
jgi:hypothetical protein